MASLTVINLVSLSCKRSLVKGEGEFLRGDPNAGADEIDVAVVEIEEVADVATMAAGDVVTAVTVNEAVVGASTADRREEEAEEAAAAATAAHLAENDR